MSSKPPNTTLASVILTHSHFGPSGEIPDSCNSTQLLGTTGFH